MHEVLAQYDIKLLFEYQTQNVVSKQDLYAPLPIVMTICSNAKRNVKAWFRI